MSYLLDTHSFIWFIIGDAQLSTRARQLIEDESNELFLSVASLWEIAIKFSIGRLDLGRPFGKLFPEQLKINDIRVLDITMEHLQIVCHVPLHHRDPFDRLIIAQSQVNRLPIIGIDAAFDSYSIKREW